MKTSKIVVAMLLSLLLVASVMFVNIRASQGSSGAVIWMNPPELTVTAGSTFGVDIVVNTSTISQLFSFFDVFLHFNPSAVQALGGGGGGGGGAYPPFTTMSYTVDNTTGVIEILGEYTPGVPPSDNIKVAYATFVCVQAGSTIVDPTASSLFDPVHAPIVPIQYVTAVITQTTPPPMYYKPSYPDYAPSGMPDFDEKQNALTTKAGQYTWCVPVAVADSLWWLDSKYESINFANPVPPPTISDHFNLVNSSNPGVWDDHDPQNVIPLVVNLAVLMDTDNLTSHDGHMGTRLTDIQSGIQKYLVQQGVASLFEVHNSSFPTFAWIDNETESCQGVVLCLEFWQQTASGWIQPTFSEESLNHGHCVTCAGSNSTTSQVSVCDPYQDAFEAGLAPGRSPALHVYPHNSTVHNDAQYVSQDTFTVSLFDFSKLPFPQPPGYNSTAYELQNYLLTILGTNPSYHAFIRLAVATSPTGVHDVAVTNVTSAKTIIGKGYGGNITETAQDHGNFDENFNVTTYANTTALAIMNFNLSSGNSDSKICVWNTTGYGYGNYTLNGSADIVPGETDVGDNNYTCGVSVHVGVPGDVSSSTPGVYDRVTNMKDIAYLVTLFNTKPASPNWNPNADVNNDGIVNMKDIAIAVLNFNQHE